MNKQEIAQKILDFCKNRYPEINWEETKYIKSAIHIWGKLNEIYVNVEVIGIKSHVVLGDVSLIISSTERWTGSFKIWLERKESQFSFKSKREFDSSINLFIKTKEILSSIFEFIEVEIQTEVIS